MTKTIKGPLVALFIFILLTSSIYGAPPSSFPLQESEGGTTLTIEYPFLDAIKQGDPIKFHIHVYNTTGSLITNTTPLTCAVHVYNSNGGHIVEEANIPWDSNGIEKSYTFTQTNRIGAYPWVISCNTSTLGGFVSSEYYVTSSGYPTGEFYGVTVFLMYFIIMFGLFTMIHAFKKDSATIVVYGFVGAVMSFIFLGLLIAGFNVFDGATFIIDVNYYIMTLVSALGIYSFMLGFTVYADLRSSKE